MIACSKWKVAKFLSHANSDGLSSDSPLDEHDSEAAARFGE